MLLISSVDGTFLFFNGNFVHFEIVFIMSNQIANQGGLASIREDSKMSEEEGFSEGVERE